jgi:hypothetical protein
MEIRELVRLQAALLSECKDCVVGEVIPCTPDESGCNWRVSKLEGRGAGSCLLDLKSFILELRSTYNLEVGGRAPVLH